MKVFTAAAALDAGAITPADDLPRPAGQETNGFVVKGSRSGARPQPRQARALGPVPALQVSSNIFFAHVGLELGPGGFLD